MNCFECAKLGSTTPAVATCRYCSAGLCTEHLRETALDRARGGLYTTCRHSTWDVRSWAPAHDPMRGERAEPRGAHRARNRS